MLLGTALYESGGRLDHVYFPIDGIVSVLYAMDNGKSAEIAVVGREGVVGVAVFMGGGKVPNRGIVHSEGHAFRMKGKFLRQQFDRGGALQHLLLRYTFAMLTTMAQTAVCNRHHSPDQQLCRWLLLSLDRMPSNDLSLTHEMIAHLLGVRPEGVAVAAGQLQSEGLVESSAGRVTVLDRPGLETRVCECYQVVKREFARILPEVIAP